MVSEKTAVINKPKNELNQEGQNKAKAKEKWLKHLKAAGALGVIGLSLLGVKNHFGDESENHLLEAEASISQEMTGSLDTAEGVLRDLKSINNVIDRVEDTETVYGSENGHNFELLKDLSAQAEFTQGYTGDDSIDLKGVQESLRAADDARNIGVVAGTLGGIASSLAVPVIAAGAFTAGSKKSKNGEYESSIGSESAGTEPK